MILSHAEIHGLFGKYDVSVPIQDNTLIVVSPNGVGKSTFLNIIYMFITKQWKRLSELHFRSVALTINGQELRVEREQVELFVQSQGRSAMVPPHYIERLRAFGLLEQFTSIKKLESAYIKQVSEKTRLSPALLTKIHRDLRREYSEDLFSTSLPATAELLSKIVEGQFLYLPTYRRIEKDLSAIFPTIETKIQEIANADANYGARRGAIYTELVSFGMLDVETTIREYLRGVRDYAREQLNQLTGSYLSDVIREQADKFDVATIKSLSEDEITNILQFVDEKSLAQGDKDIIREQIRNIQSHRRGNLRHHEKYLAHFFVKIMEMSQLLKNYDEGMRSFSGVCNKYLAPDKLVVYDDVNFEFKIQEEYLNEVRELQLKDLSSGEKQIISIFAHIYLKRVPKFNLIIDEPELSLSVPWQEEFLPDLLDTQRCGLLLAVTHSPFIYDPKLLQYSIDLREAMVKN